MTMKSSHKNLKAKKYKGQWVSLILSSSAALYWLVVVGRSSSYWPEMSRMSRQINLYLSVSVNYKLSLPFVQIHTHIHIGIYKCHKVFSLRNLQICHFSKFSAKKSIFHSFQNHIQDFLDVWDQQSQPWSKTWLLHLSQKRPVGQHSPTTQSSDLL